MTNKTTKLEPNNSLDHNPIIVTAIRIQSKEFLLKNSLSQILSSNGLLYKILVTSYFVHVLIITADSY